MGFIKSSKGLKETDYVKYNKLVRKGSSKIAPCVSNIVVKFYKNGRLAAFTMLRRSLVTIDTVIRCRGEFKHLKK